MDGLLAPEIASPASIPLLWPGSLLWGISTDRSGVRPSDISRPYSGGSLLLAFSARIFTDLVSLHLLLPSSFVAYCFVSRRAEHATADRRRQVGKENLRVSVKERGVSDFLGQTVRDLPVSVADILNCHRLSIA
jgi:hypothetical protein